MDTSKTSSIKSLLLQAWKEKWSDIIWGIRIKNLLPRGVSGDVYDLADCVLQQALVSPGANELFLSYLMYCLSSRVVSYGAVLSSIARYQCYDKVHCILNLLDLLKTIRPRIGCHGNEEECIDLCKAVVCVTYWLYSCIYHSITKLTEIKHSPEHKMIIERSYEILAYFGNNTFIKSLLYVGKFEDPKMYNQLVHKHQELESRVSQGRENGVNVPKDTIEIALKIVSSVNNLPSISQTVTVSCPTKRDLLCSSLNAIVSINAILNPADDILGCVNQLLLLKKLQNLSLHELYYQIIRACFMGIIDAAGSTEHLKWPAFTFLKVPHILSKIHSLHAKNDGEEGALGIVKGLEKLLTFMPLLDLTDMTSNCDCLQYLLNQLCEVGLVSQEEMAELLARRESESYKRLLPRPEQQSSSAVATFVLCTQSTVISILELLDSEYSKIQDAVLRVLCNMISLKNFELIAAVAAAMGNLCSFATKLIQLNEYSKEITAEKNEKVSQTNTLLFDTTFLMLCYIVQHYGIEIVTSNAKTKDTFFVTWVSECLADCGKYKCPEIILAKSNPGSVETLLSHLFSAEPDFKISQVKWHEMCINAPLAIKEILLAWEYGRLSSEKVKMILDHVKSQMCCLPVCISAWLCNYINVLHHQQRLKPMNMLQHFMTPPSAESVPSAAESTAAYSGGQTPYYKERSILMASIIKKMMYDLHPPAKAETKGLSVILHQLTISTPLGDIMNEVFHSIHCRKWLDLKSNHYLETLLCVGGAKWLADTLVRQTFSFQYIDDIHKAVDLTFGIFHLDIEQCALALLLHVVPFYLYSETHQEKLAEPHGSALSRLTVMTIYAALQSRQSSAIAGRKFFGSKRSPPEFDIDGTWAVDNRWYLDHHSKSPKISQGSNSEHFEDTPFALQAANDEQLNSIMANPINKAVSKLMRNFMVIALDPSVSARSQFAIHFLEQVILIAKDQAFAVLQFMPFGLVGQLIKMFPKDFSYELVLAVGSMESSRARKFAALSLCQLSAVNDVNKYL